MSCSLTTNITSVNAADVCPKKLTKQDLNIMVRGFSHTPGAKVEVGGGLSFGGSQKDLEMFADIKTGKTQTFSLATEEGPDATYDVDKASGLMSDKELKPVLSKLSEADFVNGLKLLRELHVKDASGKLRGRVLCKYELNVGKKTYTFGLSTYTSKEYIQR